MPSKSLELMIPLQNSLVTMRTTPQRFLMILLPLEPFLALIQQTLLRRPLLKEKEKSYREDQDGRQLKRQENLSKN